MNAALATAAISAPTISLDEAAEFAWLEADLLDRHDYAPWLALWTADGRYIVPIDREGDAHEARLNVAFDDAAMRAARVRRLRSGFSMSSAPAARTVRTVSRFVRLPAVDGEWAMRAAMHIVEYKYQRTRVLAADVEYALTRYDGALRLARKVVRLVNSDDALHGIGYLF